MTADWKQREQATAEAMDNPKVGDRFHEMYSFWVYVVDVGEQSVTTYEATGHPSSFPEIGGRLHSYPTRAAFREAYSYSCSGLGYWVTFGGSGHDVTGWIGQVADRKAANR